MKLLASWVFAEEMGCDWVTPDWGKRRVALEGEGEGAGGGGGGNGTASAVVVYCHTTATFEELESLALSSDVQDRHRCAVVDWLAYFRFDVPSVDLPERGRSKLIQASAQNTLCLLRFSRRGRLFVYRGRDEDTSEHSFETNGEQGDFAGRSWRNDHPQLFG